MMIDEVGRSAAPRYHALDGLCAATMLLGVVYHSLLFDTMVGDPPGAVLGPSRGAQWIQDWILSFRMPLFFLIVGFFARMTLETYGTRGYLGRCWFRTGIPLIIGVFTFSPAYVLTRELVSSERTVPRPGRGGPPGMAVLPGPPGMIGMPDLENLPPPPPGFVPPPLLSFDVDGDGSLDESEWKTARASIGATPVPPPEPGRVPGPGPSDGGGVLSGVLFGGNARYFQLNHLWFLWYLLVFATVAPWVTRAIGRAAPPGGAADRLGAALIRSGLSPVALGMLATPALLLTPGSAGWALGFPPATFRSFPDFLLHLDPDMLLFALYFLAGWWLHRLRDALPALTRAWSPALAAGLVAFVASRVLADRFANGAGAGRPAPEPVRIGGYALYCLGMALTSAAAIGFFQRVLDRPTRAGVYLANTALWVYLAHQPIVMLWTSVLKPIGFNWGERALLASLLTTGTALVLYELLIRPTPLVRLFEPAPLASAPDPAPDGPAPG